MLNNGATPPRPRVIIKYYFTLYYLSAWTSGSEEESILRGEAGVLRRDGGKTQVAERRHRVLLFAGKETNQSFASGSAYDEDTWNFFHLLPKLRTYFYVCLIDGSARIFPTSYATTGNRTHVSSLKIILPFCNEWNNLKISLRLHET